MFEHILVAFDGSEDSEAGVRFGLRLAGLCGGRVELVHALAPPIETVEGAPELAQELEGWLGQRQEAMQARLDSLAAAGPGSVKATTIVLLGSPAPALLDYIEEKAPDLVIAGTHGVGLRRFLLGSVSQRLLEHAGCDLLLVRAGAWEEQPSNVIVGVDESALARRALQRGQALAAALSACLVLIHVVDYRIPFARADSYPSVKSALDEHGRQLMEEARSTITAPLECVRDEVREGSPRDGLIAACRDLEPAIAVVGGRGSHALLVGSTARELVNHAPCPVLVVREPDGA